MGEVRNRRRGTTTITRKNQVTLPVLAMEQAGLQPGERVVVRADGPGRVTLEREVDIIDELAGSCTGLYPEGYLDALRDEWER